MTSCGDGRWWRREQRHQGQGAAGPRRARPGRGSSNELVRVRRRGPRAYHEHVHARHRLRAEQAHHVGVGGCAPTPRAACRARPLIVSMRAFTRPARSKSSSAAAACISSVSSATNSRCWPHRNRSMRSHVSACALLARDAVLQHAPGPRPTCASKHGRASRSSSASGSFSRRRLSPRASRRTTRRTAAPRGGATSTHVARGAAVGVGAEVAGVLSALALLARVLDGGERVALRERDERVGLVVLEVGVGRSGLCWLMRFFSSTSELAFSLSTTMS